MTAGLFFLRRRSICSETSNAVDELIDVHQRRAHGD